MIFRGLGTTVGTPSATPAQVQAMIIAAAAADGISPQVPLAVASHESGFQANAQNPGSSAAGVMQLMSVTQQTLGVTNPYDAQQNVNAGVGLLAQYYNQYGNWAQALQAYSDGPGTVQQGLPPSPQTQGLIAYVNSYVPPPTLDVSTMDLNLATTATPSATGDTTTDAGTGLDTSSVLYAGADATASNLDPTTMLLIGGVAVLAYYALQG